MAASAAGAVSTKGAEAAPRVRAPIPSAADPAHRGTTRAPPGAPLLWRALKVASRTRSEVGRVAVPAGATSERPRAVPATPLTRSVRPVDGGAAVPALG